ncbi:unannotated protein [freshwater metagenome]|uniref:Unannotated protein n=1 Tax=freshwater metagenome TaxID=449393 RepID=A0A6J7EEV2_9ZZZZ
MAGAVPAALRRAGDGRSRLALRQHRRDEDRRGQDPDVCSACLPERHLRRRCARGDGQRLPRQARLGVDGPCAPLPGSVGGRDPVRDDAGRTPCSVCRRHHLRHQQRVRVRLPTRQHDALARRSGAARTQLRRGRRGRLDPHRRGANPTDHLGPRRRVEQVVRRVRPDRPHAEGRHPLRGRHSQANHRCARGRRRAGRRSARYRQPVRGGQLASGELPEQRHQGQRALHQGQGLHRPRRRGHHRRRVHRSHPGGTPLQRGHAPGDRGQGEGGDQGREPDPRHDHSAELLPPVRQALRHDRYGRDRGRGAASDLRIGRHSDPDEPPDGPRRQRRPDLQDGRSQVRRGGRRCRRAAREGPAGSHRHHERGTVGVSVEAVHQARRRAQRAQCEVPRAGSDDHRRGRATGRGDGGDQHGRPWHRRRARRQPGHPRRPEAA